MTSADELESVRKENKLMTQERIQLIKIHINVTRCGKFSDRESGLIEQNLLFWNHTQDYSFLQVMYVYYPQTGYSHTTCMHGMVCESGVFLKVGTEPHTRRSRKGF